MPCITAFESHPARLAALAAGASRFDPGHECINGHRCDRYTRTAICVACADIRNAERRTEKALASLPEAHKVRIRQAREKFKFKAFPAAHALGRYFDSNEGRANSKYIDDLIRKRERELFPSRL